MAVWETGGSQTAAAASACVEKEVHHVVLLLWIRRAGYQPSCRAAGIRPRSWLPSTRSLFGAQRQVQPEVVRYVYVPSAYSTEETFKPLECKAISVPHQII